jgi:hypothetical protein
MPADRRSNLMPLKRLCPVTQRCRVYRLTGKATATTVTPEAIVAADPSAWER